MDERELLLDGVYRDAVREDTRLLRSRAGQLEFRTTMHCIEVFAPDAQRVIEVGAGTGRYSLALAQAGRTVTAVELAEQNFALLSQKCAQQPRCIPVRGDALDLGCFAADSFDLTLLLGPMYHLYTQDDQMCALREAVRVTRPGGIIMAAFLSVHAILHNGYLRGNLRAGLEENFAEDYRPLHFAQQVFTGFDVEEFEALFAPLPVAHLTTAATDGVIELVQERADFSLSDEEFELFARYHLHHCQRRELLGCSSHLLYIGRKEG